MRPLFRRQIETRVGSIAVEKLTVIAYRLSSSGWLPQIFAYRLALGGERNYCLLRLFLSCAGLLRGLFFLLICCGWKSVSRGWPLASLDELPMVHKAF